jgi:phospholipid transport system transporter-binding protein
MSSRVAASIEKNTLTLSGVLDYDSVLSVDAQGREWLNTSAAQNCCLDLSLVTYSSSAGIALLLGWLRVARKQNKNLRILPLPKNIVALAKVGGLSDLFE